MSEQGEYRKCKFPYNEAWAGVELFRWQYGELPQGHDDMREIDVMKGLGLLGEAIATGEAKDTNNIAHAVMRGAYEIDALRRRVDELEKGISAIRGSMQLADDGIPSCDIILAVKLHLKALTENGGG